jgi:hypothetical protein
MCFSATASFASCAVLVTIGAVAMAKTKTPQQRLLAAMPLLFAFQQFSEGFVWLSVQHAEYAQWKNMAMYSFLIFAQAFWPLFVPLAVILIEKDERRKNIMKWFALSGLVAGGFFIWCLLNYSAEVEVNPYHIKYVLDFPLSHRWFYAIIYFIPAMLPTFISSLKKMRVLGALLLISYLISRFFYRDYIVSVWCFFGALSSITVLFVILEAVAADKDRAKAVA